MNKQTLAIAKTNLRNIRTPYFITGLIFIGMTIQMLVYAVVMANGGNVSQGAPSTGIYLWLLVILAAIYIPSKNFRRIINLGGRRDGFFWGSIATYTTLAVVVSFASTAYYYIVERSLISTGNFISTEAFIQDPSLIGGHYVFLNLIELFGWSSNGIILVFLQQFAFLLLVAVVVHTIASIQDKWYGWVTDIVIAGILGTFIPIASLRVWLVQFLNLIIFNSNALMQIAACLVLSGVIYALNKPIFARKAL